jgi:hypothetical protein
VEKRGWRKKNKLSNGTSSGTGNQCENFVSSKRAVGIHLDQFGDCPLSSFEALILRIEFLFSFGIKRVFFGTGSEQWHFGNSTWFENRGSGDGKDRERKVAWLQFLGVLKQKLVFVKNAEHKGLRKEVGLFIWMNEWRKD